MQGSQGEITKVVSFCNGRKTLKYTHIPNMDVTILRSQHKKEKNQR